ncbi:MAG: hypothetical protein ACFFAS_13055 [Promethearchaeota archaeon]
MDASVRGGLFKVFVKSIRANKTNVYDTLLEEDDKEIVNQLILDSGWYPFKTYKNCVNAVAKVDADEATNIVEQWGYNAGKNLVNRVYKNILRKKRIELAIKSYNQLFKLWFNFGVQKGEIISDNELHISFEEFDSNFKFFYHLAKGWITSYFETYLNIKVNATFIKKSWEGADKTIIKLMWNS